MGIAEVGKRYGDYLADRPDGITDQEYRLHVMARAGYPFAFVVHIVFVAIFWWIEAWPLVWFNIASVILFTLIIWFVCVKNRYAAWPFVLANLVEIPAHGLLATMWFGIEPAFNFYIVNTVVMVMILPFIRRRTRVALSILYLLLLASNGAYVLMNGAVDPQGTLFNTMFLWSSVASCSTLST